MLLALLLTLHVSATEPVKVAESGPQRVALLELFTSEGCSSCPPAERWFSKLVKNQVLWKSFTPVVFHVDYWDNLGWKDKFGSKNATARQRSIARMWNRPSVYTPGVVLDGREWQAWRMSTVPPASAGKTGTLKIERPSKVNPAFLVSYTPAAGEKNEKYVLHIAMMGLEVKSKVGGGENSGENLLHDFVVLDWKSGDATKTNGVVTREFSLENPLKGKSAVAAWVEVPDKPVPLQSTGAFL